MFGVLLVNGGRKLRESGIDIIRDVPWGTHFCQFYQTKEDLIDILVPYFKAGLENNEFCMWVTLQPLKVEEATAALRSAFPELDVCLDKGQIEIIPHDEWYLKGDVFDSDRVLKGWVDKLNTALNNGFDGLRFSDNTFWLEKENWNDFVNYEEKLDGVIGKYPMIAVCSYSIDKCSAAEIIELHRSHAFVLIRRDGKWELHESEEKYQSLYSSISEGVAIHEVIYGSGNEAIDYIITDVNPAYEKILGLKKRDVIGKKASELYGTNHPPYIEIYAQVAESSEPTQFETYFKPMNKYFSISVISPEKTKFATIFKDITEHKLIELKLQHANERLNIASQSAGAGIWDWNIKTGHIEWSPVMFELLGLDIEETTPSFEVWETLIHPEDVRKAGERIGNAVKNHTFLDNQYRFIKPGGEIRWINSLGQTEYDNQGNPLWMTGICIDITERKKIEEDLRSRSEELAGVLDAVPAAVWIAHDPKGLHITGNKLSYEWIKLPLGAESSKSAPENERPETFKMFKDGIEMLPEEMPVQLSAAGEEISNYEFEFVYPDGEHRHMLGNATPLYDNQDNPRGAVAAFIDITQRKRAEEKIYRRGRLLNAINKVFNEALICETVDEVVGKCLVVARELTGSEFGFFGEINVNGHIVDRALTSPALESFKASPERFNESLKIMEIVSYWERVIKEGKSQIVNNLESDPNRGVQEDHPTIISFLGVPLKQGGITIGMIALANKKDGYSKKDKADIEIISDVFVEAMMRKRAEIRLRDNLHDLERTVEERTHELLLANDYNRNLIETSLDPLVTIGTEGKITDVNKATEKVTGYSREELVDTDFADYFTKPEEAKAGYQQVFQEGIVRDYPLEIRHKDGSITPVLYNASIYKDESGAVVGVFAAARDITERKKAEEELREYWESLEEQVRIRTEELAKSNADLKQFAYVASHDLREPLRMITSFLQLLERRYTDQLDEDANEFINFAVDGAKRLDMMIMDLLEYSRVANKEMMFNDVDIQEVVDQVMSNLNILIIENDAKITYDHLPIIKSDRNQMLLLFQNLIGNAIKYRSNEIPEVHVSYEKKGDNFVFSVRDNGIGIDPQHLERIFTIFQRLHTHEEYEGSGIGLSIAQRIVHQHGGEIWAESKPGKGSTFYFTLPMKETLEQTPS